MDDTITAVSWFPKEIVQSQRIQREVMIKVKFREVKDNIYNCWVFGEKYFDVDVLYLWFRFIVYETVLIENAY